MNPDQLQRNLAHGEGPMVEFKEARDALPRDLFETVCAFLNRDGGTILLGVADDGTVPGVAPEAVERLIREIVNLSNNPQKLDPPCILSPGVVEVDAKQESGSMPFLPPDREGGGTGVRGVEYHTLPPVLREG